MAAGLRLSMNFRQAERSGGVGAASPGRDGGTCWPVGIVVLAGLAGACHEARPAAERPFVLSDHFDRAWVAESPDPSGAPRVRAALGRWRRVPAHGDGPAAARTEVWTAELDTPPLPLAAGAFERHARLVGAGGPWRPVPPAAAADGLSAGEWTLALEEHRSVEDAWVSPARPRGFRLRVPEGRWVIHVVATVRAKGGTGVSVTLSLPPLRPRRLEFEGRNDAASVTLDVPEGVVGGTLAAEGGSLRLLGFVARRAARVLVATDSGPPPSDLVLEYAPAAVGEALALAWKRGQDPALAAAVAEGTVQPVVAVLAGASRSALLAAAPSRIVAPARVPEGGVLDVSLGLLPRAWDVPGGAVLRVLVQDGQGETEVLRSRVDPASKPEHRRWVPVRADLERWAGRDVRLVLEARPGTARGVAERRLDGVLWGLPVVHSKAAPERSRLSFVVVSADTVRADHTSVYGYARRTTPHLEAFARDATLFSRCVSTSNWTLPAHVSLFTSWLPWRHGVTRKEQRISDVAPFVTRALARAGYLTAGFTGGGYVGRAYGFAGGFHAYDDHDRYLTRTVPAALAWLDRFGETPFLVFVHGFDAHHPANPAARVAATDPWPPAHTAARDSPGHEPDLDAYDWGIRAADDAFGELLAGLERLGLAERTVVVFLSDHGEQFGEHGQWGHARGLYPEEVRVPLVIRVPGVAARRVASSVSLVDVAPTVLSLAGLPADPTLAGTDLSSLLGVEAAPALPPGSDERPLFAQSRDWSAVSFGDWSLVQPGPDPPELYRRSTDPSFAHDLAQADPDRVQLGLELLTAAAADARGATLAEQQHDLDPETVRRLRALGYVE